MSDIDGSPIYSPECSVDEITALFFVGSLVQLCLLLVAAVAAYYTVSRWRIGLKRVAVFTGTVFLFSLPGEWLTTSGILPRATTFGGVAFHLVTGIVVVGIAVVASEPGERAIERIAAGR